MNDEMQVNSDNTQLTLNDIVKLCSSDKIIGSDVLPYESIRDNSKIFLIYYARSQLERVVKLSNYLTRLEDKLMESSEYVDDPELLIKITNTIQSLMSSALSFIDKVSTNDSYIKLIYNDHRKTINNINPLINNTNNITLTRESRDKIRDLADDILSQINKKSIADYTSVEGEFTE